MKTRQGFVSNSSTSSFVCNLCGEKYSGWDAYPTDPDYECSVCPNNHVLCNSHIDGNTEIPMVEGCDHEFDRDDANFCPACGAPSWIESDEYTILSKCCPICQFQAYSDAEMAKYLLKTRNIPRDEVFAKIKAINKRRKKLYDSEYISDVCERFSLTEDSLLQELKDKFADFDQYTAFLRAKK